MIYLASYYKWSCMECLQLSQFIVMIPFISHMDFIRHILLSPLFRWRIQGPILVGKYVTQHWRQDLLSVIGLNSSYKPLSLLLFLLFLSPSLPWWNTAFCSPSFLIHSLTGFFFFLSVLGYKSQRWNRQEPCTQVICRFILYLTTFHICNWHFPNILKWINEWKNDLLCSLKIFPIPIFR